MSAAEQERAKASAHDNYSAAKSDASKAAREAEEAAKQKAKQAEESAKRAGREAKEKAVEVKNDVLQRLREDGVYEIILTSMHLQSMTDHLSE